MRGVRTPYMTKPYEKKERSLLSVFKEKENTGGGRRKKEKFLYPADQETRKEKMKKEKNNPV